MVNEIKSPEHYLENIEEAKELIEGLAQDLCLYAGQEYEIIFNSDLKYYDEDDPAYLRFPYAVRWTMDYTSKYFGKNYSEVLHVNENLDGLFWWYEDIEVSVDNAEWLFIGLSNKLEDVIKEKELKISALESDLARVKLEHQQEVNKLMDRLMEKSAL